VSAKEIERHLGVTYKTAWRMAKQVRLLMLESRTPLRGVVETDETYIGVRQRGGKSVRDKEVVFGLVERDGGVKAEHVRSAGARVLLPRIRDGSK
jgi:transposase